MASSAILLSLAALLLLALLSPATSQSNGGYQGGGYQGGGGGSQGGRYQGGEYQGGGGSQGGGYQGGGGGSQGGGYQGGGGGSQGGGYQGGGGSQGGGGGSQGGGYQGGGGNQGRGYQSYLPMPFIPIANPAKNETIVKLGQFAVDSYVNATGNRNLTYVSVLEAASRSSNDGTIYLLAIQTIEGILSRIFRGDVFDSLTGLDRLLYFRAVLA